jgi:hypothetical protein
MLASGHDQPLRVCVDFIDVDELGDDSAHGMVELDDGLAESFADVAAQSDVDVLTF